jgi:hypothetical protein
MQLRSTLIMLAKSFKGSKVTTIKFKEPALNKKALELCDGQIESNMHYIFNASVMCGIHRHHVTYRRQIDDDNHKDRKILENHILYQPTPEKVYELLAQQHWGVKSTWDDKYPQHKQEIINYMTMLCKNMSRIYTRPDGATVEDDIMLARGHEWGNYRLLTSTDSPIKTLVPFLKIVEKKNTIENPITAIDIYDSDKNELLRIDMDLSKL